MLRWTRGRLTVQAGGGRYQNRALWGQDRGAQSPGAGMRPDCPALEEESWYRQSRGAFAEGQPGMKGVVAPVLLTPRLV